MSPYDPPEDHPTDLERHRRAQPDTFRVRANDDGKWEVLDGNFDEHYTCESEEKAREFVAAVKGAVARQLFLQILINEEELRKLRG